MIQASSVIDVATASPARVGVSARSTRSSPLVPAAMATTANNGTNRIRAANRSRRINSGCGHPTRRFFRRCAMRSRCRCHRRFVSGSLSGVAISSSIASNGRCDRLLMRSRRRCAAALSGSRSDFIARHSAQIRVIPNAPRTLAWDHPGNVGSRSSSAKTRNRQTIPTVGQSAGQVYSQNNASRDNDMRGALLGQSLIASSSHGSTKSHYHSNHCHLARRSSFNKSS